MKNIRMVGQHSLFLSSSSPLHFQTQCCIGTQSRDQRLIINQSLIGYEGVGNIFLDGSVLRVQEIGHYGAFIGVGKKKSI